MKYADLRDFLEQLERRGALRRIAVEVDPNLEMTEICRPRAAAPAGRRCCSRSPKGHPRSRCSPTCSARRSAWRWAWARSARRARCARSASCWPSSRSQSRPRAAATAWDKLPVFKQVLNMAPKVVRDAPCQEVVLGGRGRSISAQLPIQTLLAGRRRRR
ncbi:MAG: UbiD family decarboxylase [Chromatiales bacterium]|nr:UbiD family decarboxylase [Chromatiales bacterium]